MTYADGLRKKADAILKAFGEYTGRPDEIWVIKAAPLPATGRSTFRGSIRCVMPANSTNQLLSYTPSHGASASKISLQSRSDRLTA